MKEYKTVKKQSIVPSLIKVGTAIAKGLKPFEITMKNQDGITESFYRFLVANTNTLRDKIIFQVAWESGTRVSELIGLEKSNVNGEYIRYKTTKHQFKCSSCGVYKRTHRNTGKPKKSINENSCQTYTPKVETFWKNIKLSPQTLGDMKAYFKTINSKKIFPYSERNITKILKTYHKALSLHDFRRGKGIWMMKNGATRETLVAFLGHKGFQAIEHYMGHQENQLNSWLTRVYEGKDTRVFSDLPVYEVIDILKNMQS